MTVGMIGFSKGSNSVELDADRVDEELKNKLITLTLATSTSNQASGVKNTKIVDLLRITEQYSIKAYITKSGSDSAKDIKDTLKLIAKGSNENGGVITMTYDGDSIEGYLESVVCTKMAKDHPDTETEEEVKYECQIVFVKGTSAVQTS